MDTTLVLDEWRFFIMDHGEQVCDNDWDLTDCCSGV